MNALAQGSAGFALVMALALLPVRQTGAASILLAIQSIAVAAAAAVAGHPALAIPPLLLAGLVWRMRASMPTPLMNKPIGDARFAIISAVILAVLCQSGSVPSVPLAVFLISMLLAALQVNPLMRLIALVGMQNGITLAGCMMPTTFLLPLACLVLPLPFAATLVMKRLALRRLPWTRWVGPASTVCMFAATLIVPLGADASVFAPLLALAGVLRAWSVRTRHTAVRQIAIVLQLGFTLLAVCATAPIATWLAIVAAVSAALYPTLPRRREAAVLAFSATGLALFGLLTLPLFLIGYFSLFIGYAVIAACVPALGVPLVILLLRQTSLVALPDAAAMLLLGLAVAALLSGPVLLMIPNRKGLIKWLHASHIAFAVLPLALDRAEGRFATLVLLVLLILIDAAVPTVAWAEIVLFPGLALLVLDVAAHDPWLLAALGIGMTPIVLTFSMPKTLPPTTSVIPLVLALLFGFFAPDSLVHWLQALTAIRP